MSVAVYDHDGDAVTFTNVGNGEILIEIEAPSGPLGGYVNATSLQWAVDTASKRAPVTNDRYR